MQKDYDSYILEVEVGITMPLHVEWLTNSVIMDNAHDVLVDRRNQLLKTARERFPNQHVTAWIYRFDGESRHIISTVLG